MITEKQMRAWLRQAWKPSWLEWREPGKGQGIGAPDAQLLIHGFLLPVELKRIENRGCKVRPPQASWHFNYWRAGGVSLFLCADSIDYYLVAGYEAALLGDLRDVTTRVHVTALQLNERIDSMLREYSPLYAMGCQGDCDG